MSISDYVIEMMRKGEACKDFITFLSIHAKGNILHMGLCENACGASALLYGVEQRGGHLWTVNPFPSAILKQEPFLGHPQWTLIEGDPLDYDYVRTGGVPEEIDLFYLNAAADHLNTELILKCWGHTVKTTGLILVSGVSAHEEVRRACEDYATSYGMKFRIRQSEADLGVIFYPDNKEALSNE
jgi:hypothetical protein